MRDRPLEIRVGPSGTAHGDLLVPDGAVGVVIFAHGSGSSRRSPRNRQVAGSLHVRGLATLLFDLITTEEEALDSQTGELRFDIGLLAERVELAVTEVANDPATADLPIGLFGASTGAAGALVAAARRPDAVGAVVSRGGRPDLAGAAALSAVRAPTLLIVGGNDRVTLELNEAAAANLQSAHELTVVPGATHLFEEPGALDEVARRAGDWFSAHLRRDTTAGTHPGSRR